MSSSCWFFFFFLKESASSLLNFSIDDLFSFRWHSDKLFKLLSGVYILDDTIGCVNYVDMMISLNLIFTF